MITQQQSLILSDSSTRWHVMYCDHKDTHPIVDIEADSNIDLLTFISENINY